jgi:mannitol 2-dehydrogenase
VKRLSNSTLESVASTVKIPHYDRSAITPGILHFGVGAFHRSHQALTLDRLFDQGLAQDWGIIGVGLLQSDQAMHNALAPQDGLYTLITKNADGNFDYQVIGSIISYLFAPANSSAVLEKLIDPAIRIVSLTITEGGYSFDRVTGEFDPDTPGVKEDLAGATEPISAFGYIVEGLRRRRDLGVAPFTIQSCDNIQGNGDVTKKMIVAFANRKDVEFGQWILDNVSFPNSMVDRITPVTAKADIDLAARALGVQDSWPVPCEPFFQWVIEDHFPTGRPPFEEALVQMVEDVMPYELMKLRLLNASHQGLCYFGRLSGYTYVHEVMGDSLIVTLLRRYMDEEATPTLLPVPGINLAQYKDQLIERFSNPEVLDTVARLAAESSDRIPKWLLPVVHERLSDGGSVDLSAAIVASWARYDEGIDELGKEIVVVDPLREELMVIAQQQKVNPLAFIENVKLFGDLADNPTFVDAYLLALNSLHGEGAQKTLQRILK